VRYLLGQRVIVNGVEIGTVVRKPEIAREPMAWPEAVWVQRIDGWASAYSPDNVKPLPNGQL
jgi:hypothetical protein